ERGAELKLVDDAGAGFDEVRPADAVEAGRELPDRHLGRSAGDVSPRARKGRQTGNRADGLAAAAAPFDGHALADGGRLRGGVFARQFLDVGGGNAGDLGDELGRIVRGARFELVETQRVFFHVVVVDESFFDDDVHHAERERAIGARLD